MRIRRIAVAAAAAWLAAVASAPAAGPRIMAMVGLPMR